MKKVYFISMLIMYSFFGNSQEGINIGFGSGTEWIRFEAGYSISEQMHAGVRVVPGFSFLSIPAYYAGFFRYTFDDNDFGGGNINAAWRGYVGGSAGVIRKSGSSYLYVLGEEPHPDKYALGISADAGFEILWGRRGKLGQFFEVNVGQVPNLFNDLGEALNDLIEDNPKEPKIASFWGFATGIRVYFGN
jgi:hypothetical protein